MHCKTTQHVINLFEQIKKVLVSISSNAQMHKQMFIFYGIYKPATAASPNLP